MSLGGLWIIGQVSGGTKFDLRSLQWASPFFYSTIHERKGTLKCLRTYSQCTQQKGGANPQGWKDNYLLEKLRHFSPDDQTFVMYSHPAIWKHGYLFQHSLWISEIWSYNVREEQHKRVEQASTNVTTILPHSWHFHVKCRHQKTAWIVFCPSGEIHSTHEFERRTGRERLCALFLDSLAWQSVGSTASQFLYWVYFTGKGLRWGAPCFPTAAWLSVRKAGV